MTASGDFLSVIYLGNVTCGTDLMAAQEGCSDIAKASIRKDCDINVEDRYGYAVMK